VIVGEQSVSLVAAPGMVGTDEFADCVPAAFIGKGRSGSGWRIANDLAPEKAGKFLRLDAGDVAVRDVQVGKAIVVEIPAVGRPGPAAHIDSGGAGDILELAIAEIFVKRIAGGVAAIERFYVLRIGGAEIFLSGDANARADHMLET